MSITTESTISTSAILNYNFFPFDRFFKYLHPTKNKLNLRLDHSRFVKCG